MRGVRVVLPCCRCRLKSWNRQEGWSSGLVVLDWRGPVDWSRGIDHLRATSPRWHARAAWDWRGHTCWLAPTLLNPWWRASIRRDCISLHMFWKYVHIYKIMKTMYILKFKFADVLGFTHHQPTPKKGSKKIIWLRSYIGQCHMLSKSKAWANLPCGFFCSINLCFWIKLLDHLIEVVYWIKLLDRVYRIGHWHWAMGMWRISHMWVPMKERALPTWSIFWWGTKQHGQNWMGMPTSVHQ